MSKFKSPKQRAFYFAKKSGKLPVAGAPKPIQTAQVAPMSNPPNLETVPQFKIPGLPKRNRFGRIKKNFRMGF